MKEERKSKIMNIISENSLLSLFRINCRTPRLFIYYYTDYFYYTYLSIIIYYYTEVYSINFTLIYFVNYSSI